MTQAHSARTFRLLFLRRCALHLLLLSIGLNFFALSEHQARGQDEPSETALKDARTHLQRGRYDEALEAYSALNADESMASVDAVIGLAETHLAVGRSDEAEEVLAAAADRHPDNARLHGLIAQLHFHRGRYEAASQAATRALQIDPESLRARLVDARLKIESGKIAEAIDDFRWFVRYYNQRQPKDAESLLLVAEGAIEYARAKSVSQIFNFVVNELTPDALKADADCWQSHLIAGNLLLEKYNQGQAVQEFNKALAINPDAADVLAAMGHAAISENQYEQAADYAQRALEINPQCIEALLLNVDVALAADEPDAAQTFIARAREIDPSSQQVLARLAAFDLVTKGIPETGLSEEFLSSASSSEWSDREFATIYRELLKRNPAPGAFLAELGEFFEQRRRWNSATRCYARAIEVAPQLSRPRTSLGLLMMRTGDLDAARTILDEAFRADPYHVRVSNMRKVLGVLEGYETISTDHFVVRFDAADRLQAEFLSEYLEEIYPALTKEFGYEPETRTPFELYSETKGQSAHSWFSARMIGLPWIQTIGASTGMIVALASPTAAKEKYDWARVAQHEFSHVVTLQATGFAIPHWYTEALAVRTEGDYFPEEWRQILNQRRQDDTLFTLDTLNQGFQRPRNGDDWQCAYCLSRLYARYIEETHGASALFQLVDAYKKGLKTEAAIPSVFNTTLDEFEGGFRVFLDKVIAELNVGHAPEMLSLAEAREATEKAPDDLDAKAGYAWALLNSAPLGKAKEVKEIAEAVIAADPKNAVAHALLARLGLRLRKADEARKRLEDVFTPETPHPVIVSLLGRILLDAKDYESAATVFSAGLSRYPAEQGWTRALAVANLRLERVKDLPPLMEAVATHDPNDATSREWLQAHAVAEGRWDDAIKWGVAAIHIDIQKSATHLLLGRAYQSTGQIEKARKHLKAAATLAPDSDEATKLLETLPAE